MDATNGILSTGTSWIFIDAPGAVQQQKRHTFTGFVGDRGNSLDIRVAVGADIEEYSSSRFLGGNVDNGIEAGRWKICSFHNHLDQNRLELWHAIHLAT